MWTNNWATNKEVVDRLVRDGWIDLSQHEDLDSKLGIRQPTEAEAAQLRDFLFTPAEDSYEDRIADRAREDGTGPQG